MRPHVIVLSLSIGLLFPMGVSDSAYAEKLLRSQQVPGTWSPTLSTTSYPIPVAISALSTLGRGSFGHIAAFGGELHFDQEIRLGTVTRWSTIFGGSIGRMESREGSMWLYGGNVALKYDIDTHRDHGLEVGLSVDVERFRPGHPEHGESPISLGPYTAYTWEFSHRFFAAAEAGLAFRTGEFVSPSPWSTLGGGVNFLMF